MIFINTVHARILYTGFFSDNIQFLGKIIFRILQEVEALKAANAEELEALRIKYLSKKGAINDLMADFRHMHM